MSRLLIHNAILVNEGTRKQGSLVVENGCIAEILTDGKPLSAPCDEVMDATGCYLLPGVIDEHVHFRDPGLTQKADILSESRAAAAGGVTSIMDMPNTQPQTTTLEALQAKQELLDEKCIVNHACYFGATNNNYTLFDKLDRRRVCGIKLFMGASTGNMLVENMSSLIQIFTRATLLIAAHCEDQAIIQQNAQLARRLAVNGEVPIANHTIIRSVDACVASSRLAVQLARKTHARLHLLHLSTNKELRLIEPIPIQEKRITAEACVPHLLFSSNDYRRLGARIKCNPAVKNKACRDALRKALNNDQIDTIATDHAPHLLTDKQGGALTAASGMPMIQFSLVSMLQLVDEGILTLETLVQKMCHAPASLYEIEGRGYLREGYRADLVLVRPDTPWTLTSDCILSKCGWSPLEGSTFRWKVEKTFANGHLIYNGESVDENYRGEALTFDRN